MNIVTRRFADQPASVSLARDSDGLFALRRPDCAAAIWQREIPADICAWLRALPPDLLPRGRSVIPSTDVARTVRRICDESGLPMGPERHWLETDIFLLADTISALFAARALRLRMEVVTTNACRRFHIDAITARLVCTYLGTGTQYGNSVTGKEPEQVFTVPTGAPFVMRGSLWPTEPRSALLHRSPPIEGTGETRLLLVLDPVFDPEDAA